jgi:3-deoxy-D-manno-octulosonic-acid transferase
LLWDTYGELRDAYAIATAAVVGGTFKPHGGHNLLEPVAAGAPVLFGPYTDHWTDAARRLRGMTPEACVARADDLASALARWVSDASSRTAALRQQRAALPDGAAIANHYVAVLSPWLREVGLERA